MTNGEAHGAVGSEDDALAAALRLHQSGHFGQAGERYRAILAANPKQADALHLLGLISAQQADQHAAIDLIKQAIEVSPGNAVFRSSLGNSLAAVGDSAAALEHMRQAVSLNPEFVDGWLGLGILLSQCGQHDEALSAFETALQQAPESAQAHNNLGIANRQLGRLPDAVDCFQQAVTLQPDYVEAHNNLGLALQEQDSYLMERMNQAVRCYQEVLRLSPARHEVQNNLSFLYAKLVPRWHFPMMNDSECNDAYEAAINSVVKTGDIVLNIGSGSGLLAMLAARAGARHVYSCEVVKPIADKAVEIVQKNGFADRVTVLNKMSTDLRIGEDIPERVDVVVTETFDTGLVGEHALSTLTHAHQELLKPGGRVIPGAAVVYAMLIESESLWQQDHVEQVSGFDLSPFNDFSTAPHYLQVRLNQYQHAPLSAIFQVYEFDLTREDASLSARKFPVTVTQDGTCHGVAFWYRLRLAGETFVSTAPRPHDTCWKQALQALPATVSVQAGDCIEITVNHDDRAIHFALSTG